MLLYFRLNSTCKSSKKLLEQSQKIEKAWSHVFSWCINLDDSIENWYRKLRETIDRHQSEALWISECKVCITIVLQSFGTGFLQHYCKFRLGPFALK